MPSKLRKHLRGFTCSRQGHSQRLLELHTYLQHICHANYQCRKKSGEKGEGRSTSRQPREGRRNRVGKKTGGWVAELATPPPTDPTHQRIFNVAESAYPTGRADQLLVQFSCVTLAQPNYQGSKSQQ
uniref:Uncharacterized protein n=1 Tax=Oryza nivara TaxID=4536 RepID=A0A0E0FT45_ORYNI